jgi:hypothetical protein
MLIDAVCSSPGRQTRISRCSIRATLAVQVHRPLPCEMVALLNDEWNEKSIVQVTIHLSLLQTPHGRGTEESVCLASDASCRRTFGRWSRDQRQPLAPRRARKLMTTCSTDLRNQAISLQRAISCQVRRARKKQPLPTRTCDVECYTDLEDSTKRLQMA